MPPETPQEHGVGRIDIHSHLLPGVDDGCENVEEAIQCIAQLKAAGFTGSVCTPHMWPQLFPQNTPTQIEAWTEQLQRELKAQGIDYTLWPGGELRLFKDVTDWLKIEGVPTLGRSRGVLFDYWDDKWPRWLTKAIEWLLDQQYQPIFAHPERLMAAWHRPKTLQKFLDMGVWLQGNVRSMTGEEGYQADELVRRWLAQGRYHFMALDMHRPDTLDSRLRGMQMIALEFGPQTLDQLTIDAPRRLILGAQGD